MKVLISGFEPFGGEKLNSAMEAVRHLNLEIGGVELVKVILPTVFDKSTETLIALIEKETPEVVICVGQAGGRTDISIERVAINIKDAALPDNEKNFPKDLPIAEDGPAALFSTLPIKKIAKRIRDGNIPSSISNTAGTFVCNQVMYSLLHYIETNNLQIKGGFVHVPYLPSQVLDKRLSSMDLALIVKGLALAIEAAIEENVTGKKD
ncbi:MAG: pyroglutamyl-peptidase I [Firmicutes bacterium]|nr:pyroglutamyl-peptidase I [Bacillota bacterium]MDD4264456.1 pyroglutamyl-peptidase I [Bacillota bacterium]MDD4694414.1 pyroglutamyl-peptidase I [Bacillota bacterium]